jgi:hypothetical protein
MRTSLKIVILSEGSPVEVLRLRLRTGAALRMTSTRGMPLDLPSLTSDF